MRVEANTKLGKLFAIPTEDNEYPGIAIFLERGGRAVELAVIEQSDGQIKLRAYDNPHCDEPSTNAVYYELDQAIEMYGYEVPKKMDAYERAKKLIDDFCQREYGERADFRYPNKVGVAYTTVTDDELELQVNVNLTNFSIDRFLDGIPLKSRKYKTLGELVRCELEWLDFSDLVDIDDEDIAHYRKQKLETK